MKRSDFTFGVAAIMAVQSFGMDGGAKVAGFCFAALWLIGALADSVGGK